MAQASELSPTNETPSPESKLAPRVWQRFGRRLHTTWGWLSFDSPGLVRKLLASLCLVFVAEVGAYVNTHPLPIAGQPLRFQSLLLGLNQQVLTLDAEGGFERAVEAAGLGPVAAIDTTCATGQANEIEPCELVSEDARPFTVALQLPEAPAGNRVSAVPMFRSRSSRGDTACSSELQFQSASDRELLISSGATTADCELVAELNLAGSRSAWDAVSWWSSKRLEQKEAQAKVNSLPPCAPAGNECAARYSAKLPASATLSALGNPGVQLVRVVDGHALTLLNKAMVSPDARRFVSLSGVLAESARFGAGVWRDCDGSPGERLELYNVEVRRLDWTSDGRFRVEVLSYESTGGAPCGGRAKFVTLRWLAKLLD